MKPYRRILCVFSALISFACDRGKTPVPIDSAAVRPAGAADSATTGPARNWNASAGPVLLVASDEPSRAFIIAPDSATAPATIGALPHPASVTLFSRAGSVQTADLPAVSAGDVCPVATLSAAPPPRPWNVGFVGGVVAPLVTDSIENISRADSASLVVWMNRLASALPNDSAGHFTGLPFVVRTLWRVTIPGAAPVVIGTLDRRLNQEATPLQEHTFLVAEFSPRDSTYTTAYSERAYGVEETIQNQEILAATLLGTEKTVALVIARDFGDAISYGLIERGSDGRWRQRWTSPRRHC